MSSPVAMVREEDSVRTASRVMARRGVSGIAVLDGNGNVSGMVTASDIIRFEQSHRCRVLSDHGFHLGCIANERVSRLMTRGVLTAPASAPLDEVARRMTERKVHRLIVTRGGRAVGIVTSADLARCLWKLARGESVAGERRETRLAP